MDEHFPIHLKGGDDDGYRTRLKSCGKIPPISKMRASCDILHATNPCKILSDAINTVVVDPINDAFGVIDVGLCDAKKGIAELKDGFAGLDEWWDDVKDDVDILVKDMDLIMDVLNMNIFSYLLAWLRAITGMSLQVVRVIAIVVIVVVILALAGGLASLLGLFL